MSNEKYLIWSNEHNSWWRPASSGYTNHIAASGRYERAEAINICKGANFTFARGKMPNEIPVLEQDAIDGMGEREKEEYTW